MTVTAVNTEETVRRSFDSVLGGFVTAVAADTRITLLFRGEEYLGESRRRLAWEALRLCGSSDAFLALLLYRLRVALRSLQVPLLPALLHRGSMVIAQVSIGDPVVLEPGIYLPHGSVVVDGFTSVGSSSVLFPFTTLGLVAGVFQGPTLGRGVHVGTGAKVLGPVVLGAGVRVGANAVVLRDVPDGATAVGIPARVIR